jgi:predicted dienelactone hydrolase
MLHQPLDILFALQQLASSQPEGLQGMFDTEHAGAMGYSFDGYNALALSGARIDPQHYLGLCKDPLETKKTVGYWFEGSYNCWLAQKWDSFAAETGEKMTNSTDGLWQPITDPRIQAVMPLAADGYYLFGDKGLAAIRVPAMFIIGTNDTVYAENALIFDHYGSTDKTLISIINRDHLAVIDDPEIRLRLRHFAVAFFGYQLQGKQEYADYYSKESVNRLDGMAWGVIEGNSP